MKLKQKRSKLRVLHLSLKRGPFEVMVTGEKDEEYREPSEWIKKRLYNKDGSEKQYDVVKFTNGYGSTRPQFVCKYEGFIQMHGHVGTNTYSNGFKVTVKAGMFIIHLGRIGITRNCEEFLK